MSSETRQVKLKKYNLLFYNLNKLILKLK